MKWTNSRLNLALQCGERYYRQEILKDIRPRRTPLVRGSTVHQTIRPVMNQKLKTGALPSLEEVRDLAADAFTREWIPDGIVLDAEEQSRGVDATRDRVKDTAIALAGLHRRDVAPGIAVTGVEYRVTVAPKDSDLVIEGTIDLLSNAGDGDVIVDTKTGVRSPNADTADRSMQLSTYGLLRFAETGTLPIKYRLDHLIETPARRETKVVRQETTRDQRDMAGIVERLQRATRMVEHGIFLPAPADAWFCSPVYCPYHVDCPFVRRGEDRPEN